MEMGRVDAALRACGGKFFQFTSPPLTEVPLTTEGGGGPLNTGGVGGPKVEGTFGDDEALLRVVGFHGCDEAASAPVCT